METLPLPPPPYMTDQQQYFQEPPPPYIPEQQQYFQEPPPPYMPDQQQFQESALPNPVAASTTSNPWHSSGSIGPFFAVISVLSILAILSCLFARTFVGRDTTPLESINHGGGCSGWLKGRWRRRIRGGCIGIGAKAMVGENGGNSGKVSDGV